MPFLFNSHRLMLKSIFIAVLLTEATTFCLAGEPLAEKTYQPADPREVFQKSGINSFDKGALSNIVLRGYQRENLMITFDGAPYFGSAPFRSDAPPVIINKSDISTIIVTKGPYNLAYPGGAGGSIEVISPENQRRFTARGSVSYGSFDAVNGIAVLGIGNQSADFSVGYRGCAAGVPVAGDGVSLVRTPFPNPNNNFRAGVEDQDMYRMNSIWLKAGINPDKDKRLELSYSFLQGNDVKFPTQNFDINEEKMHRLNGRFTITNITSVIRELSLQGWWSQAQTSVDDSLRESSNTANQELTYRSYLSRDYSTSSHCDVTTTGGRIGARLALGSGLLKTGIDLYQRAWEGNYSSLLKQPKSSWHYYDNQALIPDVTATNVGMFFIYEVPLAVSVRAVASIRGDISKIKADGLTAERISTLYQPYFPGNRIPTERDFSDWSANAQLFWKVQPNTELFVKGGRAVRIPDASELYMGQIRNGCNLISNPFIRQTVVSQIDTGGVWAADGHRIELTFFYGEAKDFILPTRLDPNLGGSVVQARSTANLDAVIWGLEFDSAIRLSDTLRFTGMLSYSQGENRTSGSPLAEIPPLRGRLTIRYDNRHLFACIDEILVARQNRFDPSLNETSTAGYAVTNLMLGGRYKGFTFTANLNNLFDSRYVMPIYYQRDPISMTARIPENGRNFMLTANCRF